MVGAPNVDHAVVAAPPELVAVIGDVGCEVGGRAVAADNHVVLIGAKRGRREPLRAVAEDDVAALPQERHRLLVAPVRVQVAFAEPNVELHADAVEVGANDVQHPVERLLPQARRRFRLVHLQIARAAPLREFRAQLLEVRSLIAVLRQRRVFAQRLRVAGEHGAIEQFHLRARVVHVVLARHLESGGGEHPGERAA